MKCKMVLNGQGLIDHKFLVLSGGVGVILCRK